MVCTREQEVAVPVERKDGEDVPQDEDSLPLMESWQMNSTDSF